MPAFDNSIDHIGLPCPADLVDDEVNFLNTALAPLNIKEQFRVMPLVVALGDSPQNTFFWVTGINKAGPIKDSVTPVHFAFKAKDRAAVDKFYKAGLAAGGKDNGEPGIRKHYHAGYYAAFLISPCGHNIEAVIHESPE